MLLFLFRLLLLNYMISRETKQQHICLIYLIFNDLSMSVLSMSTFLYLATSKILKTLLFHYCLELDHYNTEIIF